MNFLHIWLCRGRHPRTSPLQDTPSSAALLQELIRLPELVDAPIGIVLISERRWTNFREYAGSVERTVEIGEPNACISLVDILC